MTTQDYIIHYGMPRRSGRYKWGSGERPRQSEEKSRKSFRKKRAENKIAKERALSLKKEQELEERKKREQERRKELQERKAEALLSDPASKILKDYKGNLTNVELDYVVKRLQFEKTLSEYSMKEIKSGKDKIKEMVDTGKLIVDVSRTGIDLWNTFATMYNSTSNGKDAPLEYIKTIPSSGGGKEGKKK